MPLNNLVVKKDSNQQQLSLRQKVNFYFQDTETKLGLGLDLSILGLILLSSIIFVLQTYNISQFWRSSLEVADLIILVIFTAEYILRLWSAEKPRQFLFSLFGFIDLLSILPLLLGWIDIRFLRVFRWFRILRIVRFWKI